VAFPYSAGPAFTDIIKRMCGVLGGGRLELVGSGALSLNGDYPGRGDDFGPGVHVAPTLYFRSIEQRVKRIVFFISCPLQVSLHDVSSARTSPLIITSAPGSVLVAFIRHLVLSLLVVSSVLGE